MGVEMEEAIERLALVFSDHANDSEFDLGEDHPLAARRELRQWIKRGLIVERSGKIMATDAFQKSLMFHRFLEDQSMTSTASRLATVQRAIEILELQLSAAKTNESTLSKLASNNWNSNLKKYRKANSKFWMVSKPKREFAKSINSP